MKNPIGRYELEELRAEIKDYLVEYIEMCAKTRIALIQNGEINDVLVAIKGEIAMAAMEGRVDLSKELSERFEELASVEVEIDLIKKREIEYNYS